jgi:energy-coupling factor transporter ATP-binding protein EcfA2
MTILREIQVWSEKQPDWQQDALARLYAQAELSVMDYEEMYSLLRAAHGLPKPAELVARTFAPGLLAAAQVAGRVVQIAAIKNLSNVNALATGQRLSFAPGLTGIFGENGSGKSGYTRVFKQACRARDQREAIHPNANAEPGKSGPAQADFELSVNGLAQDIRWISGKVSPEELSALSVFDGHCARAYVDNHGDFAYVPAGLDILKKLVDVCGELKAKAVKEHSENAPNIAPFAELAKTDTKVGKLLAELSAATKPAVVEALAAWQEADKVRLAAINAALSEANPKDKAQTLRNQAARLAGLATRIKTAVSLVDDVKLAKLDGMLGASTVARAAADLASAAFKEAPGQLPGTGGEAWQKMFQAARLFAAESHPGKEFAHLGAESDCPLCQNPLTVTGAARIKAFDVFVQLQTEQDAKTAKASADAAVAALQLADIDLLIDEALANEIRAKDQKLADDCANMQKALTFRKRALIKAAQPERDWAAVEALPADPSTSLGTLEKGLIEEAVVLEASMDEAARSALVVEGAELDACRRLSELKAAVLLAVEKYVLIGRLLACSTAAGTTTAISRKSTQLSETMATKEVMDALNDELLQLNLDKLKVVMKPTSSKGRTQYKLVLEVLSKTDAKDILSEGEQRAIAIASFLAEIKLGKGLGGVLFDDPMSSLDHVRREHVARRIAKEAQSRQVIVFTHDLFFLNILLQETRALGLDPACRSLRRTAGGYGVADDSLPFEGASTRDRVGILRQMLVEARRYYKDNDDRGYRREARDIYAHLRMSWERGVEELLFNGVVLRFRKGIETNRLSKVTIEPADVATIQANMGKCSNYTGHDGATGAQLAMPLPDEVAVDIEALEVWRKEIVARLEGKKKPAAPVALVA